MPSIIIGILPVGRVRAVFAVLVVVPVLACCDGPAAGAPGPGERPPVPTQPATVQDESGPAEVPSAPQAAEAQPTPISPRVAGCAFRQTRPPATLDDGDFFARGCEPWVGLPAIAANGKRILLTVDTRDAIAFHVLNTEDGATIRTLPFVAKALVRSARDAWERGRERRWQQVMQDLRRRAATVNDLAESGNFRAMTEIRDLEWSLRFRDNPDGGYLVSLQDRRRVSRWTGTYRPQLLDGTPCAGTEIRGMTAFVDHGHGQFLLTVTDARSGEDCAGKPLATMIADFETG